MLASQAVGQVEAGNECVMCQFTKAVSFQGQLWRYESCKNSLVERMVLNMVYQSWC